jgi:hypothetical protein
MVFVFVVCTNQIKTIENLNKNFKLKELDFYKPMSKKQQKDLNES